MTLRLIDGFDYNPSSAMFLAQGWVGNTPTVMSNTAFNYGYSLRTPYGASGATAYRSIRGRITTPASVIGVRMYIENEPRTGGYYFRFGVYDSVTSSAMWYVTFSVFGIVYVTNGDGVIVAQSPAASFVPTKWFYLEIKFDISTTAALEVRINTVPVISAPIVDLTDGNAMPMGGWGWTHLFMTGLSQIGYSPDNLIDDLYILDNQGSVNNDFLGNSRAKYMPAVGESSVQFSIGGTVPAATNWQSVLNTGLDDTKFVYSSTIGHKDLYQIDPVVNAPYVFGLEVSGAYKQDDATQRFGGSVISSGGVEENGPSHALNQSYTVYPDIYELNPDTGVAFTGAEVNALLVGPRVDV